MLIVFPNVSADLSFMIFRVNEVECYWAFTTFRQTLQLSSSKAVWITGVDFWAQLYPLGRRCAFPSCLLQSITDGTCIWGHDEVTIYRFGTANEDRTSEVQCVLFQEVNGFAISWDVVKLPPSGLRKNFPEDRKMASLSLTLGRGGCTWSANGMWKFMQKLFTILFLTAQKTVKKRFFWESYEAHKYILFLQMAVSVMFKSRDRKLCTLTSAFHFNVNIKNKTKLGGFSPQANYTDRATAACRRS
jgi:hypothetical protein